MLKYLAVLSTSFFILVSLTFIWGSYKLIADLNSLLSSFGNNSINNNKIVDKKEIKNDLISQHKLNSDHYETTEETITRLKHDVIVTGTITGMPGQESAMFQIEGMADRVFNINTQLMDGFIIKEITGSHVTLKNQLGNETFTLYVQNEREPLSESMLINEVSSNIDRYNSQVLQDSYSSTIPTSSNYSATTREIAYQENNERDFRHQQNKISPLNDPNQLSGINNESTSINRQIDTIPTSSNHSDTTRESTYQENNERFFSR